MTVKANTEPTGEADLSPDALPEGWTVSKVQEAFESFGGGTPNRGISAYWDGSIPWLSSGDIKTHRIESASESITKDGLENSSASMCRAGSVLVVVRSGILAHTLPVGVLACRAAINQDIKCFDSGNNDLNAWLALALRCSAKDILTLNREGTTVQSVKYDTLKEFSLRIPPLPEQKRLVAKIEDLLAHVNAAREHLSKAALILKRFRQAVLIAACRGQLTVEWRRTHKGEAEDSRDLIRQLVVGSQANGNEWLEPSFVHRVQMELPESWQYVALGNVGTWGTGGTPSKSNDEYWVGGEFPWVSPKDMKTERILDSEDHITGKGVATLKIVPKNSILFVVRGMILAHTFPVALTAREVTINQDIRYITPYERVVPAYLLRALQNEAHTVLFAVLYSTHGTRRLESPTLKPWPIPLPSIAEQREIVRLVESLFKLADSIEERVEVATKRVEKMTRAILAKAFRGELVPTEAELARREGRDYEPASVLLERIRADGEKPVAPVDGKRRRRQGEVV